MKKKYVSGIFLAFLVLYSSLLYGQNINPDILQKRWAAFWLTVPDASPDGYGVYLFRKTVELNTKPTTFIIHVSADNRYKLYVNEKLVSLGPARGDLSHWNFETVDLAPYLKAGKNILAAQVWNEGEYKPEAQISFRTGFILQGATATEATVNTNNTWKCTRDNSYAPLKFNVRSYYVAGAGEIRNMAAHPKSWQSINFNDEPWLKPQHIFNGLPKTLLGPFGTTNGWMLVPSGIPQMELKDERLLKMVSVEGGVKIAKNFPTQKTAVTIPANSAITILLDQTYLTNAYPNVFFNGGKGAAITVKYAETLYSKFPVKGNRNETKGMQFLGRTDSIISDGTNDQRFTPLTYRTYRYVQLKITTQSEPLVLNDFYGTFTGYPFELKASTASGSEEINKILNIGWRTARLCATETYMDCPYYEQLQYIGDGRIQALISLYNTGDDRLVKNAINQADFSRQPEGVTLSRHPSYTPQYIPTFSLWYIGMLHDYSKYGPDSEFVKSKISGTRQILDYFRNYQQADGSLKNVPQWMFTDWVDDKEWRAGVGPMSANGTSALLDLQLLWAYQLAADLETKFGNPALAAPYEKSITQLKSTITQKYLNKEKNLFADREEKDTYSQHTNSLAILTGIVAPADMPTLAKQLITNTNLAPASIYFKFYLHQALIKAGLGNDYLKWLDKWRENIQMGLTTWAETSDLAKTRSDCHAWGASPNIEFYRTILGIDSDGPAFSKVKIEPHLGEITNISGEIPHPQGKIAVQYKADKNKWKVAINLPKTVTGTLVWKGKSMPLKAGVNQFSL
ncbi:family 78 glycoside hydrolase catalytic domain [Adhaeribacter radiodurans]|uniref:Family 78 glycoside hydrolase catalytic domain n=1 Tax=Adhaeribacter radiodurans TaxID=2745197 RepID=A0A7L7L883_9BACT|nr:family 78 glycoside hydrolase catalytic domain [Adhaeribacter radiodurans]QMU29042.1 family 78 glycoside hydrolase catalytic domain [Adhaeribacter radiodurans]